MLNSPVEEIKQRLDIVDVLSEYLQFKKAGGNFRALCPFHHEKTPSFMVSKEKQIWHCFGCSKGGDVFSFVQEMEGMEFPEVLRLLAKKANVELTYQDPKVHNQKTKILDILNTSADWFASKLDGEAKQYLVNRNLSEETIEEFKLGYAPDEWEALSKFLLTKNYSEDDIFQAGLTIKKDKGVGYYDRLRGRVMFPIRDLHGGIVGFTARLLKEDPEKKQGKYINTPQTLVYDKSQVIYGLDKAKQNIKKLGATIVVEGNMDVITAHQAGFKNVVASSGTAFTDRQINLLKRYSPNLIIAFDMDAAGAEAAKRSIDTALGAEMNVKVLTLEEEFKDPDECIQKDPAKFKQAVSDSQNIMDYYFASATKQKDASKVEDKKKMAIELLPVIGKIGDTIEQTHYLQKLADLINVSEDVLRQKISKNKKQTKTKDDKEKSEEKAVITDRFTKISERLIALAIINLDDFKYFADNLNTEYLHGDDIVALYKKLIEFYNQKGQIKLDEFTKQYPDTQRRIEILSLLAEKDFSDLSEKDLQNEAINSIKVLEKNFVKHRIKKLEKEIKQAEEQADNELVDKLMQEINLLTQKLTQL